MSLNADWREVAKPLSDEEREDIATLAHLCIIVGVPEISKATAPEFFARVHLLEAARGAFRMRIEKPAPVPLPFTEKEIHRFIGLKTNAGTLSRPRFLAQQMNRQLDDLCRRYRAAEAENFTG